MKITECSYCGILAITDEGVCTTCKTSLEPELPDQTTKTDNQIESSSVSQTVSQTFSSPRNHDFQNSTASEGFPGYRQSTQLPLDSTCLRCGAPAPRSHRRCSSCETKSEQKSSPVRKLAFLGIFLALLLGGYLLFYYEDSSPAGVLKKYERASGADPSLIFENFSFNGKAHVFVTAFKGTPDKVTFQDGKFVTGESVRVGEENYSFKMVFKKPNKSKIEFTKSDVSPGSTAQTPAFIQAFDGVNGWRYSSMMNQKPTTEKTDDAFADRSLGLGLDKYDSVELLNDAIASEFGKEVIQSYDSIKTFEVSSLPVKSEEKVIVHTKKTLSNQKIDNSLMIFDKKSGFLLGVIKKSIVNGTTVISTIFIDKYRKFPVNYQGFFGVGSKSVLVPTSWKFVMEPPKSTPAGGNSSPRINVTIELNVEELKVDTQIDDAIFIMPGG